MKKNYHSNETYEQLYDPAQCRFRTIHYIEKIYGSPIYKQLVKETSEARLLRKDNPNEAFSPQLISSMKKICLEKFPDIENEIGKPLDENILNQYRNSAISLV